MTSDTKVSVSWPDRLQKDKLRKLLIEIFKASEGYIREDVGQLRLILLNQDDRAWDVVKKFISTKLSSEIIKKTKDSANILKDVDPSLEVPLQKNLSTCLIAMLCDPELSDEKIKKFYKDISHWLLDNTTFFNDAERLMPMRGNLLLETMKEEIPDLYNDNRVKKRLNAFWKKEIVEYIQSLPARNKKIYQAVLSPPVFYPMMAILIISSSYYLYEPSWTTFLLTLGGVMATYASPAVYRLLTGSAVSYVHELQRYMNDKEDMFVRISHIRELQDTIKIQLRPLPTLAQISEQLVAPPPITPAVVEDKKSSRENKLFDNKRGWTDINLSRHFSTDTQPTVSPLVDLSRELGHGARCFGGSDENNTLFSFCVSKKDVRYVFISPKLQEELQGTQEGVRKKIIEVARHAKLASSQNEAGIKMLPELLIKEPGTDDLHKVMMLKISGGGESGEIRLLGALISIRGSNGKIYPVYVFNTLWKGKKTKIPTHFSYPLCAHPSTTASSGASSSSSMSSSSHVGGFPRFIGETPSSARRASAPDDLGSGREGMQPPMRRSSLPRDIVSERKGGQPSARRNSLPLDVDSGEDSDTSPEPFYSSLSKQS